VWQGYPSGVQQIRIPAYGFKTVDAGCFPLAEKELPPQEEVEDWS